MTTFANFVWKIVRYVEVEHHDQDRTRTAIHAKRSSNQLYLLPVKPVSMITGTVGGHLPEENEQRQPVVLLR